MRRGPRLAKAFSPRSGSRAMMPRTSTVTSPTFTRSPSAMFMRRSADSSTTAPHTPSFSASASASVRPSLSSMLP